MLLSFKALKTNDYLCNCYSVPVSNLAISDKHTLLYNTF